MSVRVGVGSLTEQATPVGAFLALPTAAFISSFISNYATTYDVVYQSANDDHSVDPATEPEES